MNKIENSHANYFVIDKHGKEEEMKMVTQLLMMQIGLNLKKKEMKGESVGILRDHLSNYLNGLRTVQNVKIFEELLVEANAQLKLLKLPEKFKKYENLLKTVLYRELHEFLGEDPDKVFEDAMIKIHNQMIGIDPFIVKDGSEPEMKDLNKAQMNLIDLADKMNIDINLKKDKNEQKAVNTKSIYKHNNDTFVNKFNKMLNQKDENNSNDSQTIKYNDNDIIDLSEANFEQIENEDERKKLLLIQELYTSILNGEVTESSSAIDIKEFTNKTLLQLKALDIDEIAEYDTEITEDGDIRTNKVFESDEVETIEKELALMTNNNMANTTNSLAINSCSSDTSAERTYFREYDKLANEIKIKDAVRGQKIEDALESGEYLDDPVYIAILYSSERFKRLREKFLKKYFSEGIKEENYVTKNIRGHTFKAKRSNTKEEQEILKIKNKSMPLLDKYAKMPGDIITHFEHDNVFYQYDHAAGKKASQLWKNMQEEIDDEEKQEETGLNLAEDLDEEEDDRENLLYDIKQFLQDNTDKTIYNQLNRESMLADKSAIADTKKIENKKQNVKEINYAPGRKNKKLKLL